MCLLTNFPLASRLLWRCRLHSGLEVLASADCMKGDCGVDIYENEYGKKARGITRGIARGIAQGIARGVSPTPRTSLREALEIRIADFKGCVLLPLLLLLFE